MLLLHVSCLAPVMSAVMMSNVNENNSEVASIFGSCKMSKNVCSLVKISDLTTVRKNKINYNPACNKLFTLYTETIFIIIYSLYLETK